MDLLYTKYSSPMDLMKRYINQGRFGAFVEGMIHAENERRQAEAKKEEEMMLWIAYVHSNSEDTFNGWRKKIFGGEGSGGTTKKNSDHDLTDEGIMAIVNRLFPE